MRRVAVLTLLVVLAAPGAARAEPEDVANDISNEIMSPYCPGATLHDCPSDAAVALRERILGWVEDGWSRERILNRLEAEYGSSIRSTPPASGIGLWAWVAPGLAVAAGLGAAWMVARRWSGRRAEDQPVTTSAAQRSRLDAELARAREEL